MIIFKLEFFEDYLNGTETKTKHCKFGNLRSFCKQYIKLRHHVFIIPITNKSNILAEVNDNDLNSDNNKITICFF